jgi:hypothetical protein
VTKQWPQEETWSLGQASHEKHSAAVFRKAWLRLQGQGSACDVPGLPQAHSEWLCDPPTQDLQIQSQSPQPGGPQSYVGRDADF